LLAGGTATTANVVIGMGSTGSTTPDLLVLATKTTTGDPTGVNGAMYYNSALSALRCYQGGVWTNCAEPPTASSYSNATFTTYGSSNLCHDTYPTTCTATLMSVMPGTAPSITPTSTSEQVLISGTVYANSVSGGTTNYYVFEIIRGTTCAGTQVGNNVVAVVPTEPNIHDASFSIIDSPATTSAQSYTICSYANEESTGSTLSAGDVTMTLLGVN
jgi:hypothetical protein